MNKEIIFFVAAVCLIVSHSHGQEVKIDLVDFQQKLLNTYDISLKMYPDMLEDYQQEMQRIDNYNDAISEAIEYHKAANRKYTLSIFSTLALTAFTGLFASSMADDFDNPNWATFGVGLGGIWLSSEGIQFKVAKSRRLQAARAYNRAKSGSGNFEEKQAHF